jgi:hypothetical protein
VRREHGFPDALEPVQSGDRFHVEIAQRAEYRRYGVAE